METPKEKAKILFDEMLELNNECTSTEMMVEFARLENESLLKQNAEMRDLLNTIFLHIVPLKRMLEDPYKSGLKSRANQITELLTKYK